MSKKNFFIIAIVLLAISMMLSNTAFSQRYGKNRHYSKNNNCRLSLNLSEQQKSQLETIELNFQKETLSVKSKIETKTSELNLLIIADQTNQKNIDKKIEEISSLREELQKKCVKKQLAIRNILTKEQKVNFDKNILKSGRFF